MAEVVAVSDISALLDVRGYLREHAGDYDVPAMHAEIARRLTKAAGRSVVVAPDGVVTCALGDVDYERSISWRDLCEDVDIVDVAITNAL